MTTKTSNTQKTKTKTEKRPPFSWTQPCCAECWVGLVLKTGRAAMNVPGVQFCCYCRTQIESDVYYVRVNPGTTPYPTIRKEDDDA